MCCILGICGYCALPKIVVTGSLWGFNLTAWPEKVRTYPKVFALKVFKATVGWMRPFSWTSLLPIR